MKKYLQAILFYIALVVPALALNAPDRLVATSVSPTEIQLKWRDRSTTETGFSVYRSSDNGLTFTKIADLPLNATTFSDSNLLPATSYVYRVTAFAVSVASNTASATTSGTVTPPNHYMPNAFAAWPNSVPYDPNFFPIAVWWQDPNGCFDLGTTCAHVASAEHINIFLGTNPLSNFGVDDGDVAELVANGLHYVAGINTSYTENTSANSVASQLALATSKGALPNLIGYNAGDEPDCSNGTMGKVPSIVAGINGYDPTRIVTYNFTAQLLSPSYYAGACLSSYQAAMAALPVTSFDIYPVTAPWLRHTENGTGSDFNTVPFDAIYTMSLATWAYRHYSIDKPVWQYVESGGDNLGQASENNYIQATTANGSTTVVNKNGYGKFTPAWIGLTLTGSGIASGTTVVSVTDDTHAVMSRAAIGTNTGQVFVTGGTAGDHRDCLLATNFCVVNGNQYRATPAQVNSEAWNAIIAGARGIEWFCHDISTPTFCLGAKAGGGAAQSASDNLTYINATILQYAPILNSTTAGECNMWSLDINTNAHIISPSCHGGVLSMATSDANYPGLAMLKNYMNGDSYLFAQSNKRGPLGATYTFTMAGYKGGSATVVYDSNQQYDTAHSSLGLTIAISDAGVFSDAIGQNSDYYEVKIYKVHPLSCSAPCVK